MLFVIYFYSGILPQLSKREREGYQMKTASLGLLEVMVVRVNARSVLCMMMLTALH